jgi:uncharacterized membrane protein YkvA (DUF1232 family)
MAWNSSLNAWAKTVTRDVVALSLAARDPRVPWYAKATALAVAAYAISPIDLIPDFVPVLGWLDELVVLPLGIILAVKLIPPEIMAEHRAAALAIRARPTSFAAAVVIAAWIAAAVLATWALWPTGVE